MEIEALREQYLATKRHRITVLGKQLQAVEKALEKRDLSEVPTPKLLELALQLSTNLASDEEPLQFTASGLPMPELSNSWIG